MQGTVKWFNRAKGYGFIAAEDGTEIFVHYTSIQGEGYRTLKDGDQVKFDVGNNEKGRIAVNVEKQ